MTQPKKDASPLPVWMQWCIQVLIIYSIVTVALATMPELAAWGDFFAASDAVVTAVFTVEYLYLWYASENRLRYPFGFFAVVDLLAILPFYLSLGVDLRPLRVVRILRIFRLLKLAKYNAAGRVLVEAARRAAPELTIIGVLVGMTIVVSAMLLYYAEHEAQPEVYSSIPASLWWSIVTLTTVGYGDVYPITTVGRLVASVIMLCGVGVVAAPTGVIAGTMTTILEERKSGARPSASASIDKTS